MAHKGGLWIAIGESESHDIEEAIQSNMRFTRVIASADIKPKPSELCIVSLTGDSADYLGISQAGARVATGQRRLTVSHIVDVGVDVSSLKEKLPNRLKRFFPDESTLTTRISPKLWEEMLDSLLVLRPMLADSIRNLRKLVAEFNSINRQGDDGLELLERDAVTTALQVWGGTQGRKRVLGSAGSQRAPDQAPFLSRLPEFELREDSQIFHDSTNFPGMEIARQHAVGYAVLENEQGGRLTIMNCNRQPLESTLGVDLIYYNHRFDSFVMVQYKRMISSGRDSQKMLYRPNSDSSYGAEIDRMRAIGELLAAVNDPASESVGSFRLSTDPFYFKLCKSKAKAGMDVGMVAGMYLPLGLWDRFVSSPAARGERGGISIGWDNCSRRLSNTEFTSLLSAGWIGSCAGASQVLGVLIERVLGGDRMLVIAATSTREGRADYLRNQMGQFATSDDPDATW